MDKTSGSAPSMGRKHFLASAGVLLLTLVGLRRFAPQKAAPRAGSVGRLRVEEEPRAIPRTEA